MDILLKVFADLGANQTLFLQFIIVIIMYIVSRFVFIDRLQQVLQTREERTSKLEGDVEKQFEEIKKIQDQYKEKIQTANKKVKVTIEEKKNEIIKSNEAQFRVKEKEINQYIDNSKKEVQENINSKKEQVMGDAESLAQSLVQKISKGN